VNISKHLKQRVRQALDEGMDKEQAMCSVFMECMDDADTGLVNHSKLAGGVDSQFSDTYRAHVTKKQDALYYESVGRYINLTQFRHLAFFDEEALIWTRGVDKDRTIRMNSIKRQHRREMEVLALKYRKKLKEADEGKFSEEFTPNVKMVNLKQLPLSESARKLAAEPTTSNHPEKKKKTREKRTSCMPSPEEMKKIGAVLKRLRSKEFKTPERE